MKTKEGLEIYNAHPCGCFVVETKTDGTSAQFCKTWFAWMWDSIKGKCWSIEPHVCFKVGGE